MKIDETSIAPDKVKEAVDELHKKQNDFILEEVAALFNSGVLSIDMKDPEIDLEDIKGNYNITISQALRLRFTAKERIIELEQRVKELEEEIVQLGYEHRNELERMDM